MLIVANSCFIHAVISLDMCCLSLILTSRRGLRADAYVGTRLAVPEGIRVAAWCHEADAVTLVAEAAMLLLRRRVQEQHRSPQVTAAQGLPDPADALQAQAWSAVLRVPAVRQGVRGARRLAHP